MKNLYLLPILLCSLSAFSQHYFQKTDNTPINNRLVTPVSITASIPYQGYEEDQALLGQGEYEIFLDEVDGILDKPIIVLDGFDPGDARSIDGIYNSLGFEGENIGDIIRQEGFDIVVLNAPLYETEGITIDGGADYIQRNAMVLIELINFLNSEKQGEEELVVLGPSMGGLISRYALSFMEANDMEHETRLFISFDAPHRGANIPINIQYLINYLAEILGDPTAESVINDVLKSPAAKEMLVDHLEAHLLEGTFQQDPTKLLPEGAPNFREAFQEELDQLGFPEQVRNVAMINGSNQGITTGTPGMQIVDTTIELATGITTDIIMRFTPEASATNTVVRAETFFFDDPLDLFTADAMSFDFTDGVDSAPGGTSNFSAALGEGNPIITEFIEAIEQDEFCFIPTISALAIDNEEDWYAIPDLEGIHNSPFVNTHIPDSNEDHVSVTSESIAFALDEIRNDPLSIDDFLTTSRYRLLQNPVGNQIQIALHPTLRYTDIQIKVYNTTGQQVFASSYKNPSSQIVIEQNLKTGVYFIQIEDSEGNTQLKLIKK